MARLLIATVGTSLLTNHDDRPWTWAHWKEEPLPDPAVVDAWLATADPIKISAEMNTLHRRESEKQIESLFYTRILLKGNIVLIGWVRIMTKSAVRWRQCVLKALSYQDKNFAQRGLKSLISVTIQEIRYARERGLTPIFCATGGFKAEIAFLNLLGALLNIEVYYIHELHREEVLLPRLL